MVFTANTAAQLRKNQFGQQPVAYYSRDYTVDSAARFVGYNLPFATPFEVESDEGREGGVVLDTLPTTGWDVWADALANATLISGGAAAVCPAPKVGDKLTDASGLTWLVVSVEVKQLGAQNRLKTTRMM